MGSESMTCSGTQNHSSDCDGSCTQPLDIDALLAIDAKRTPGEWWQDEENTIRWSEKIETAIARTDDYVTGPCSIEAKDNAAAIVSAVNALRPLIERCKRAEADYAACRHLLDECCDAPLKVELLKGQVADLTRQRDELLKACEEALVATHLITWMEILEGAIRSVRGGTNGTAG